MKSQSKAYNLGPNVAEIDCPTRPPEQGEHSPLPWRVYHLPKGHATGNGQLEIQSGDLTLIAYTPTDGDNPRGFRKRNANAAYIVKACNEYPKLIAALMALVERTSSLDQSATAEGLANCDALAKARSVISSSATDRCKP